MLRDLILVSISFFIWGIGEGLFFYFQPIYLQQLGATPVIIGGILGLGGVAMAIVQAPSGYLADRYGNRRLLVVGWIIGVVAAAIMAFSGSLVLFTIGWVVYGFSAMNPPASSYVTSVSGKLTVGRALTLLSAAYNLGAVIGPVVGGYIGQNYGLHLIYRFSLFFFILSTIMILLTRDHKVEAHPDDEPVQGKLIHNRQFILILAVIMFTIFAGYLAEPLTPNFLQNQQKVSIEMIGNLGAIGSLGNAVITLSLGGINPSSGIIVGHLLLAFFSFLLWKGNSVAWFGVGYFLKGGYRLYQAMYLSIVRSMIHSKQVGLAYGFVTTVNAVAIIIAPVVAGGLYTYQPSSIYSISLILIAISFLLNLVFLRKRRYIFR
jgi:DHA1 family multidrug resistance protein-like MFS transporter